MTNLYDQILKKILDSMTITPEGVIQWHGFHGTEYNRHLSLLLSNLMLDNKFQSRLNNLRYYLTSENDIFFGSELTSIFKMMKQENKFSFNEFKEKLNYLLDKIEKDSKPAKYDLYYPINIKTEEKTEIIKFRDVQIELKKFEEIKNIFEDTKLKESFKDKLTKFKYEYIKVTILARNQNYAEQVATKYANLIVGIIAYFQNYRHAPVTIIGIPKELTELKLNYIFAFKEGGYSGHYYFDDKSDERKIYQLNKQDVTNLNDFIKMFNTADKKIQEIVYKSMSSYYLGLTERRVNISFFNFWIALEIISLKKKGIPHIEIIRRLKSILINLTPLEEHKIDKLYSIRNNLVHDGSYNISQYDRNLLKIYVEIMIEFFMYRLSKFNTQEIQSIFNFLQKDDKTLEKSKKLIDFIIELRKNNAQNND